MGGTGRVLSYLPLDNFGSVTFQNGYTVAGGSTQTISGSGAQLLDMAAGGRTLLASASGLDTSGGGFTVTRTSASASVAQTAPIGTGSGRWHRTGVGMRHYTNPSTIPSSSVSPTSSSNSSNSDSSQSQTVTNVSVTPGQWTTIPLGAGGWVQILFR